MRVKEYWEKELIMFKRKWFLRHLTRKTAVRFYSEVLQSKTETSLKTRRFDFLLSLIIKSRRTYLFCYKYKKKNRSLKGKVSYKNMSKIWYKLNEEFGTLLISNIS